MEEPGVPQSMGSQRVGHDLATEQQQRTRVTVPIKKKKKLLDPCLQPHYTLGSNKLLSIKHTSTSELEADEDIGFT